MKKYLWILIVLAGSIYLPSLQFGFSQDDFIHLSASHANSVGEFLNFFNPNAHFSDIFFYRPLTTQVWFFINQSLFGLNPLPFHLEALFLHIINGILFYLIVRKVFKSERVALISAVLYTLSVAHFLSLYYISSFQEIGKTFFIFLSILLFPRYLILSVLAFVAALLSKETAIVLPFLLITLDYLKLKKLNFKKAIPFFLVAFVYVVVRLFGFQTIFGQGDYHLTSSISEVFQNLKWYVIWSFGLPEILDSYPSLVSMPAQFIKDYSLGGSIIGFVGLFIATLIVILTKMGVHRSSFKMRTILPALVFIIFSLAPVLILHEHKYPQYLDSAFLMIIPSFVWILLKNRWIGALGITTYIIVQFLSLSLSVQTHWATHRAEVADYYHQQLAEKMKGAKEPVGVVFVGDTNKLSEVSVALAHNYALEVWFPGKVSSVSYGQEFEAKKAITIKVDRY